MSDEICQRCGEAGTDRRTLWMACLYEMRELGLPFEELDVLAIAPTHTKHHFYTLRVCKDCRGDWMGAIRAWFHDKPVRDEPESGIYVRELGATREVSAEEFERRRMSDPDKEPSL